MMFARGCLAAVLALNVLSSVAWAAHRPKWTKAKPHFEMRDRRAYAVAVGRAEDANEALAAVAAEGRARADLLRLLQGRSPGADVEGEVKGAVVAEVWRAGNGIVYVRLELESSQPRS